MQFFIDIILTLVYGGIVLLMFVWVWRFWMMYINQKFLNKYNNDCILLEIKLPREISKSPAAMETVIFSFLQGGGVGNWYYRNWLGNLPHYFSMEIASIEGVIHFYIRLNKRFKELVTANLYAQYPGIEVIDAEDYTKLIHYTHLSKDVDMWGSAYPLSKEWTPTNSITGEPYKNKMKADYLPLRTYVDYTLDKDPKEEFKNDPLVPLLEFMGSMGKGEHAWYQVIVQDEGAFNNKKFPATYVNKDSHVHMTLAEMAKARKEQLRGLKTIKKGTVAKDTEGYEKTRQVGKDADGNPMYEKVAYQADVTSSKKDMDLTGEEKDEIEAINRKLSKPTARAVVRIVYLAKKERFNPGHINNITSIIRPFNSLSHAGNSFGLKTFDPYEYPWQNFRGRRTPWRKEEGFESYVEREGFYPHVGERATLDRFEDMFFWPYPMKVRKVFRMIVEGVVYPFEHPSLDDVCVLNTEELATLYHFPGQVASVPTLPRIDSAKGVAPSNLPQ